MFNNETVKELAHSNPTASAVFLALSERERNRHETNLDLLRTRLKAKGVTVDEEAYIAVFRKLEELNIGRLVFGRKGNSNYFMWKKNLKEVAHAGIGNSVEQEQQKTVDLTPTIQLVKKAPAKRIKSQRYITVRIPLDAVVLDLIRQIK